MWNNPDNPDRTKLMIVNLTDDHIVILTSTNHFSRYLDSLLQLISHLRRNSQVLAPCGRKPDFQISYILGMYFSRLSITGHLTAEGSWGEQVRKTCHSSKGLDSDYFGNFIHHAVNLDVMKQFISITISFSLVNKNAI